MTLDDQLSPGINKGISAMKSMTVAAAAVGAAVVAATAIMAKAAGEALKFADTLDNQAKATNLSAEGLQVFNQAAEQAGQSSASITTAVQRLQRGIIEGTSQTNEAFQKLGVNVEELKRLAPEQQFRLILSEIGKLPNPTDRAATSMILLGRSGANLQALAGDAIPKLEARMRSLGLVVDNDTVASMDRLEEQIDFLTRVGQSLWRNFGVGIASSEGLTFATEQLTQILGQLNVWVQANSEEIGQWVNGGILAAAKAVEFTLKFVGAFIAGLGMLGGVLPKLDLAFLNWYKTLLESPIAKFIPGVQSLRENMVSYADEMIAGAQANLEFFAGVEQTGTNLFVASEAVADFQANLLQHIETSASAKEVQDSYNISMQESNEAMDAAKEKTEMLTALNVGLQEELLRNTESFFNYKDATITAMEELGEVVPTEFTAITETMTAGVGDLEGAVTSAFQRMGLTSRTELQMLAEQAVKDYETIRASGEATEEALEQANKKKNEAILALEETTSIARVEYLNLALNSVGQLLGAFGAKNKAAAIAKATIDGWLHVQRTIATIPWPLSIPAGIAAAAIAAINVGKIASQPAGYQIGTPNLDFENFGIESMVRVHGEEAIIPRNRTNVFAGEVASGIIPALLNLERRGGGGSEDPVLMELKLIRNELEGQPLSTSRLVAEAVSKIQ